MQLKRRDVDVPPGSSTTLGQPDATIMTSPGGRPAPLMAQVIVLPSTGAPQSIELTWGGGAGGTPSLPPPPPPPPPPPHAASSVANNHGQARAAAACAARASIPFIPTPLLPCAHCRG